MGLKKLLPKGESETLEFKKSTGEWKEIVETISAFSNTKGGRIIIGVSKSGKFLGVEFGKDTIKNIAEKQYSRNPIIAKALAKVKYIEELGEGWNKIIDEHSAHPLKPKMPKIKSDKYTSIVTIFSTKDKFEKEKKVEKRVELNQRQKKALEYIKENGKISNAEYRSIFKISAATAKRELRDLVKKGICRTFGAGPSLHYLLK